jgi:predicted KAP-like P-loop ATPase
MKINPPQAPIGEKDPFEHALFGRKQFAESLTNLLRNVEENLVVFVNAPWGEGKTTFTQMWRESLKRQQLETIYFDAFAADYFDDPFIAFSSEILEFAGKNLPGGKELEECIEFKKTAIEVGKRVAGFALKSGLRAVSLGLVQGEEIQNLMEGIAEISADVITEKIEKHEQEKDALKDFKKSLEKLAAKVR